MKVDVTTLCVVTSAFICGLRKNSFILWMKEFLLLWLRQKFHWILSNEISKASATGSTINYRVTTY